MALNKSGNKFSEKKIIQPEIYSNYNQTGDLNPSHFVDEHTNYIPRTIDYEMADAAFYNFFNNRFNIRGFSLTIFMLDQSLTSIRHNNARSFDSLSELMEPPFLTMYRVSNRMIGRVSPTNKHVYYSVPKLKENGQVVYEEYIGTPPRREYLEYELKLITYYRNRVNDFESQINELFKNRYVNLTIDTGDKFTLRFTDLDSGGSLEKQVMGNSGIFNTYVLTYQFRLEGYFRDAKDVQKRERIAIVNFDLVEGETKEKIEEINSYSVKKE